MKLYKLLEKILVQNLYGNTLIDEYVIGKTLKNIWFTNKNKNMNCPLNVQNSVFIAIFRFYNIIYFHHIWSIIKCRYWIPNMLLDNLRYTLFVAIPILASIIALSKPILFVLNPLYGHISIPVILFSFHVFLYVIFTFSINYIRGKDEIDVDNKE